MNNIVKAAAFDFSLVRPYLKTMALTLLLPAAFAAVNRSLMTGISFAMCFTAMTTGYTFSITEKNSMERLLGILPVRRSHLVIGRYLFVLLTGLVSLVFSLAVQPVVLRSLGETVRSADISAAAAAGILLFALYTVFQIPGYYKFGSIKGRVFMYIPVAGFLVTLLLSARVPAVSAVLASSAGNAPLFTAALAVVLSAAMYALSVICSVRIVKNKEM